MKTIIVKIVIAVCVATAAVSLGTMLLIRGDKSAGQRYEPAPTAVIDITQSVEAIPYSPTPKGDATPVVTGTPAPTDAVAMPSEAPTPTEDVTAPTEEPTVTGEPDASPKLTAAATPEPTDEPDATVTPSSAAATGNPSTSSPSPTPTKTSGVPTKTPGVPTKAPSVPTRTPGIPTKAATPTPTKAAIPTPTKAPEQLPKYLWAATCGSLRDDPSFCTDDSLYTHEGNPDKPYKTAQKFEVLDKVVVEYDNSGDTDCYWCPQTYYYVSMDGIRGWIYETGVVTDLSKLNPAKIPDAEPKERTDIEKLLMKKVNDYRESKGIQPWEDPAKYNDVLKNGVQMSDYLWSKGRRVARNNALIQSTDHESSQIGAGQYQVRNYNAEACAEYLFQMWYNSPAHNRCMLDNNWGSDYPVAVMAVYEYYDGQYCFYAAIMTVSGVPKGTPLR